MEERLGATVRELRESRGWTKHTLAREAGINSSEVARLEEGKGPSWRVLEGVAKAFSLSVSDLTATVPRAPDQDPILAQQVEGIIRAVDEDQMGAQEAIRILERLGFLERRPAKVSPS